jgi:outer membrane biosynthesis protein TonB
MQAKSTKKKKKQKQQEKKTKNKEEKKKKKKQAKKAKVKENNKKEKKTRKQKKQHKKTKKKTARRQKKKKIKATRHGSSDRAFASPMEAGGWEVPIHLCRTHIALDAIGARAACQAAPSCDASAAAAGLVDGQWRGSAFLAASRDARRRCTTCARAESPVTHARRLPRRVSRWTVHADLLQMLKSIPPPHRAGLSCFYSMF